MCDNRCVVCRHEYEEGDAMLTLPCKHNYHSECIQQWLRINKVSENTPLCDLIVTCMAVFVVNSCALTVSWNSCTLQSKMR